MHIHRQRTYALEPQTKQLVIWLVLIHNVFSAVKFSFSGGSVMSFGRHLLGTIRHMGVIGIAVAMACDWVIRGVREYHAIPYTSPPRGTDQDFGAGNKLHISIWREDRFEKDV